MKMELNRKTLKSQRDIRAWRQTQLARVSGLSLRVFQRVEKTGIALQESAKSIAVVYKCSNTELLTDLASKWVANSLLVTQFNSSTESIRL